MNTCVICGEDVSDLGVHVCQNCLYRIWKENINNKNSNGIKWINVKDKLPDPYDNVLVSIKENFGFSVHEGYFNGEKWYAALIGLNPVKVTHWMEMPEFPN